MDELPLTDPSLQPGLEILHDMELSGGSPRDLSAEQLPKLREIFLHKDIGHYMMATVIFGYKDLIPSLHYPISQFLGRWGHSETTVSGHIWTPPTESDGDVVDSDRRLMLCIPREMFKTSLGTRVGAIFQLAKDHDHTIGIFNEKEENAQDWVGAICEVIENSTLFRCFGET